MVSETTPALISLNGRVRSLYNLAHFNRYLNTEQRDAVFGIASSVARPRSPPSLALTSLWDI